MDALAFEPQFLDHLAPVWNALPAVVRGRFLVDESLVERARAKGIDPTPIRAQDLRAIPQVGPVFDGIPTLVASIGDIKVGRRLGHGPYAFLEHGAGQSYDSRLGVMAAYAGGPDRADNELFMVPNEYAAAKWRAAYPRARVEVVGSPRLDGLPRREAGPGPVVATSFHWDGPNVPYGGNALGDYLPVLSALAKAYTTIGHAHPKGDWPVRMERLYRKSGILFVPDFDDVCRQADVYVCDNSTTLFEFASTGRPVVLLNASTWHKGHGPGGRFWDWAHVGINVDRPEQLIPAVAEALEDSVAQQAERADALSLVYQPRTNGAAYAATAVMDWLASRQAVAA